MSRITKSAVSLILTLAMVLSMGVFASAANTKAYKLSETITAVLNVSDGKLIIEGTGEIPNYPTYSDSIFRADRKTIKSVEIKEGITVIGNYTFYEDENLETVKLPSTLVKIGGKAFNSCKKLKTVEFSKNSTLRSIGYDAFAFCQKLENINFPETLEEIGQTAFYLDRKDSTGKNMPFMKKLPDGPVYMGKVLYTYKGELAAPYSLTVKEGTVNIHERALQDNKQLKSIVLPSSIKEIERYAFMNCTSLSSVNIPENTDYIGSDAFHNCSSLKKLRIPENTFVESLFDDSGIRTIEGWQSSYAHQFVYDFNNNLGKDEQNKKITFVNLADHDHKLTKVPAKAPTSTSEGTEEYYKCSICGRIYKDAEGVYPASCTDKIISVTSEGKIGENVRYKLYDDKTLIIYGKGGTYNYYHDKDGKTELSDLSPFSYDTKIKKIIVEEGITYLGNDLFSNTNTNYYPVEEVILPDSLIEIGDRTFRNCDAKTIKLGNNLEIIGTEAFANTDAAFKLNKADTGNTKPDSDDDNKVLPDFPATVKIIKDNAFKNSAFQQNIIDNGSPKVFYIGTVLFRSNFADGSVEDIKAGTTCIYNEALADCRSYYEDELFFYENDKHELELAKDLIYIGYDALKGMKTTPREYYGKVLYKAKDFDTYVDENLDWLRYKVRPGTYSISPFAFNGTKFITHVNIPEGVVLLGENAFSGSGITSVDYFSSTVNNISAKAFYKVRFSSAPVSENTEKIENMAYLGCETTGITIPGSVKEIGAMAFQDTTKSWGISFSQNLVRVGSRAFYNSRFGEMHGDLPANLEYAGPDAFPNIPIEADKDGLRYIGKVLYDCDPEKVSENIVIKEGTTQIADKALMGAAKIKSITIPESVTYIGDYAFSGCTGLSALELPKKLTHLGRNILDGNKNVSEITINSNILSINYSYQEYGPIWGSGIKTVYATDEYSSPGGYYASICGAKHIETNNEEHFLVPVKGTAPTCTKTGIKAHYKCRICERVFAENNEETETDMKGLTVPSLPHTPGKPVKENIVEAAYGKDGSYDEVIYCTVCKSEISRKKVRIPAPVFIKGDANGDSEVTAADARIALRCSVGLEKNLTEKQKIAADVDGTPGITAADARIILRVSVGLEKFR